MMNFNYLLSLLAPALLIGSTAAQAAPLCLVPQPNEVIKRKGLSFALNAETQITYSAETAKGAAELFALALRPATGFTLNVVPAKAAAENSIHFEQLEDSQAGEAYKLETTAKGATISAGQLGGFIYGSQTLRQLLPAEAFSSSSTKDTKWEVPAVTINDAPVYPWRGVMLDVSRYFLNKDYVKHYIDIMAMHKLNVLHWHLIDDCGWRIEIKKYPKLTEVGAWRGKGENRRGGFYTQEDIKEIVAYAAARNIQVVPEIEIPAHTLSALVAYPHLGCFDKQFEVPTRHSISPEIYCVGKETTWEFLEDVMDEVVALFPAKFVHIGGDEARFDRWNSCPHCQAVIKKEKLKNSHELQGWTTTRIQKVLEKHDKQLIGWAEILECGVSNKAGIMAWHKPHHVAEAAKNGNPVVNSLVAHTYFDTPESKLEGEPPAANWTAPVTLSKAYNWDPTPNELFGTKAAKNILGGNGCLWTDQFLHAEHILADKPGEGTTRSERYVDYLSLPRLAALAEVTWTNRDKRDFDDFKTRMAPTYNRYLLAGYNFRMPTPELTTTTTSAGLSITGTPAITNGSIRYTTDGSTPTASSPSLTDAVIIPTGGNFKAVTFSADNSAFSLVESKGKTLKDYSKFGKRVGEWKSGKIGSKKAKLVTFDATGLIDSNGEYVVTFIYESGEARLDIDGIKIVRNDTDAVGKDMHHGFTGGQSKNNSYTVKVSNYQTGASFKIKSLIYGDINDDSNGVVVIKKK